MSPATVLAWLRWLLPVAGLALAVFSALQWLDSARASSYAQGVLDERAIWKAQEAQRLEDQALADQAAQALAQQLAAQEAQDLQAAQALNNQLQKEIARARIPLVTARACPAVPGPEPAAVRDGGGAAPAEAAQGGGQQPEGVATLPGQLPADLPGVLTGHAVGLWDQALGAVLPAGACGTADAPAAACAAASPYSLADAWVNHVTNASRCAVDRQRHARLIAYLQARQAAPAHD